MNANPNYRAAVEALDAASVLAERLLCHARGEAVYDHPDRLNQRELVTHAAAVVALLAQALQTLELIDELDHQND